MCKQTQSSVEIEAEAIEVCKQMSSDTNNVRKKLALHGQMWHNLIGDRYKHSPGSIQTHKHSCVCVSRWTSRFYITEFSKNNKVNSNKSTGKSLCTLKKISLISFICPCQQWVVIMLILQTEWGFYNAWLLWNVCVIDLKAYLTPSLSCNSFSQCGGRRMFVTFDTFSRFAASAQRCVQ